MMTLDSLTVMILTFDEEDNIDRTLKSISWAKKILVVDSFSKDATAMILERHPCVRILKRPFASFADQCNFGLSQIDTKWTLSIDADYVFPINSELEITKALNGGFDAYSVDFSYCIAGKPVRGSILPPRTVLYQTQKAKYRDDGHCHRVLIDGTTASLPFVVQHDDRKPLDRWLRSQVKYAKQEAEKISSTGFSLLERNDRIRKLVFFAPPIVFVMVYFFKGAVLSGWRGLFYAMQRFVAELLVSLYLLNGKIEHIEKKG